MDMDLEQKAIMRLREAADTSERFYKAPLIVTTSGGKDSSVCVALAEKAGIEFEVMHNHTTVDAPETVYFVRREFKRLEEKGIKCTVNYPHYKGERVTMWSLIPQKLMPPTRLVRYCCSILKERGGQGRYITTGVRWAESTKRKNNRGIYETMPSDPRKKIVLNNDNDDRRRLFETCMRQHTAVCNPIDRILQFRPNPYMTAADFYYKLAAQYKVYNNAIAYPVFDETGRLTAVYPINAQYFELLEYMGTLYCRFTFATGATYICEYSRIIHVRRHFLEHDIFGDGNKPLDTALKTANTLNQSMSKFAELVAVIRGILKVSNAVKTEDLNRRRDDFIRDNLRMENNGAGVIVTDAKYDYTPITDKTTPIPATQLAYVKEEIYDYLGVSKEIVENTATPQQEQAFYSGEIAPFFRRLSQAFSNVLFTEREFGYGNRIVFSANSVQFATLPEKVTAAKFLTEIGAATLDQILTMFDMPTIGGEEGARRVQTLNMVNAKLADKYQTGGNTPPDDTTPPGEPTGGKEEG